MAMAGHEPTEQESESEYEARPNEGLENGSEEEPGLPSGYVPYDHSSGNATGPAGL